MPMSIERYYCWEGEVKLVVHDLKTSDKLREQYHREGLFSAGTWTRDYKNPGKLQALLRGSPDQAKAHANTFRHQFAYKLRNVRKMWRGRFFDRVPGILESARSDRDMRELNKYTRRYAAYKLDCYVLERLIGEAKSLM
jgi:hypothetical protein